MSPSLLQRLFRKEIRREDLQVEAAVYAGTFEGQEEGSDFILEVRFSHSNDLPVDIEKMNLVTERGFALEKLERTFHFDGTGRSEYHLEKREEAYLLHLAIPVSYLDLITAWETDIEVSTASGRCYRSRIDRSALELLILGEGSMTRPCPLNRTPAPAR